MADALMGWAIGAIGAEGVVYVLAADGGVADIGAGFEESGINGSTSVSDTVWVRPLPGSAGAVRNEEEFVAPADGIGFAVSGVRSFFPPSV